MATYDKLNRAKPVITEGRAYLYDYARQNFNAVADACIMGALVDYNYSWTGGSKSEPATLNWAAGNDRVRAEITWGSAGGEDGNPTAIKWTMSDDGWTSAATIGTESYTWDASGYLSSTTWS